MWERDPGREVRAEEIELKRQTIATLQVGGKKLGSLLNIYSIIIFPGPLHCSAPTCKPSSSVGIHSCASLLFGGESEGVVLVTNGKGWHVFSS